MKDEAKTLGAKWCQIKKTWYCSKKKSETELKRFQYGYISDQDDGDADDEKNV